MSAAVSAVIVQQSLSTTGPVLFVIDPVSEDIITIRRRAEGGRACVAFYTRPKSMSFPRRAIALRKLGAKV